MLLTVEVIVTGLLFKFKVWLRVRIVNCGLALSDCHWIVLADITGYGLSKLHVFDQVLIP